MKYRPLVLHENIKPFAAAKGEQRLINEINNTLLRLEKEGKADEIYNRWFGPDTKSAQPRGDFKFAPLSEQAPQS